METNEKNNEAGFLYLLLTKLDNITTFCDFKSRTKTYTDDVDYVGNIAHEMKELVSKRMKDIGTSNIFPSLEEKQSETIPGTAVPEHETFTGTVPTNHEETINDGKTEQKDTDKTDGFKYIKVN